MGATGDRLDQLNIALMLAACAAAFALPFELFLFAYAVLGPLHYLTEISWIHDRGYFVDRRDDGRQLKAPWLTLVGVTLAVMLVGLVSDRLLDSPVSPKWEIGLFYLVVLAAGLIAFRVNSMLATAIVMLAGAGLILFSGSPAYGVVAFLIITIVHVLVFTGAFLLGGALKSRSRWGFASVAVYLACIASFFLVVPASAAVGDFVRRTYQPFEALNIQLLRLLDAGSGLREIYQSSTGAAVMRLIAFAYTYHYLNWFTKTSVIGWNKVPRARALAIVALWLAALAVYAWDYLLGFVVLYSLSVLHVMLELPLNHHSFAAIGRALAPQRAVSQPVPVTRQVSRQVTRQAQRARRKQ